MQTIIIPTDYSDTSQTTIEYGALLAKKMGATLLLYHAFSLPAAVTQAPIQWHTSAMLIERNEVLLQKLSNHIQQAYQIHIEYHASPEPIIDELTKLVSQKESALVVMGKHTANDWERTLFGSNSAAIIRKAAFPVLIIPEAVSFHSPARMIFACDYKSLTYTTNLDLLHQIAGLYDAEVQVLYIIKDEKETSLSYSWNGVNLDQLLKDIPHHYLLMKAADVVEGIEKGLQQYDAELLVMAPHRYTFWDIVLRKSITRKMAFRVSIPLLLLPLE